MGDLLLGPGAFKVTQFAADADWDVMQSIGKGELVRIAFPIYVHALDALAKVPITTFNDFAISLPHLTLYPPPVLPLVIYMCARRRGPAIT